MWQALLINLALKLGTQALIILLRKGADVLEQRQDNDFQASDAIKSVLTEVRVDAGKRK